MKKVPAVEMGYKKKRDIFIRMLVLLRHMRSTVMTAQSAQKYIVNINLVGCPQLTRIICLLHLSHISTVMKSD